VVLTGSLPVLALAIGADLLLRRAETALALRSGGEPAISQ
jgi:ABC-type proline/glycine betaine transport system permease subunit